MSTRTGAVVAVMVGGAACIGWWAGCARGCALSRARARVNAASPPIIWPASSTSNGAGGAPIIVFHHGRASR